MEKFLKSIPLITGALIFLGYINYTFYYFYFDIEISSYLTTGELLLSFLKLTIPILFIIGLILLLSVIGTLPEIITKAKGNSITFDEFCAYFEINLTRLLELFKKHIKTINFRSVRDYWKTYLFIMAILNTFAAIIFMFLYPCFLILLLTPLKIKTEWFSTILNGCLSIYWLIILQNILNKKLKRVNPKSALFFAIGILFLINIIIFNKGNALLTLNGKPKDKAIIYTSTDTITTSESIVFIGKTENYIFLRNISDRSNVIYQTDEIKKYIITTIERDNKGKALSKCNELKCKD